MSPYLLFISLAFPVVSAFVIRLLNLSKKQKEPLYLATVIINTIITLVLLFVVNDDKAHIISLNRNIEFYLSLDGIGKIFAGMVAILWPFAYLYVMGYMEHDHKTDNYSMFYVMTYAVVLGISFSGNLLTMYFFYELLTFITLPLIIYKMTREARRAGRNPVYGKNRRPTIIRKYI